MRFKLIVAGLVGVFALYAAFWAYMANEVESRLADLAADEDAKGNQLHWETLTVTGFPARMRVALTDVAYVQRARSPKARFIMTKDLVADFLPYRVNHAILDFPRPIILDRHDPANNTKRLQTIITFETAHMSIVTTNQSARVSFEGTSAAIRDDLEGDFSADRIGVHLRPGASPRALDLYTELDAAILPAFAPNHFNIKAKTTAQQGQVLFQGLNTRDWVDVGGILDDIDFTVHNDAYTIFGRGAATLSPSGILRAKLDVTVDQTNAFLSNMAALQNWSDKNRTLIESLVNMADLADGAPDQRAQVSLVADEKAVMAGPFLIDGPVNLGPALGF